MSTLAELVVAAGATVAVAVATMSVTAVVAWRQGRVRVVDVTWGLALTGAAIACAVVGEGPHRWLVAGLVAAWGLRLSWHIWRRSRGQGEDPRYAAMLTPHSPDVDRRAWFLAALPKVFVLQAAAVCLVAWPLMAASVADSVTWPVVVVGVVVWAIGWYFEVVGDAQLAAYRADPDRRQVLDTGLWAWTRHPNYFGDAAVWWGIWLAGAASTGWLPALLTLPAPAAMTWFLAWVTGARPLERTMMQRPGYREYAARTPMFVPRPPKRAATP